MAPGINDRTSRHDCPAHSCFRQSCKELGRCYLREDKLSSAPCADTDKPGHGWERVNTSEQQTAPAETDDSLIQDAMHELETRGAAGIPNALNALSASLNRYTFRKVFGGPVLTAFDAPKTAQAFENILEEADRLTSGDRNDSYDHPYHNFSKIAAVWSILLGMTVTPHQVGYLMMGLKLVRENHKHKRDNIVDLAGYARTIEMIDEWEARPKDANP